MEIGVGRHAGTHDRDRRRATAAIALLGLMVVAQSSYRAAHQSIAHDEACTYNWFIASPANVFNYDPNNHVLATYLEMACVAALGASELTLRLPTLLATLLYVGAVVLLVRIAVPSPTWAVATGALLLLNPLVLDYLVQARGYGLALAFLLWGVDLTLLALLVRRGDAVATRRWWLLASLALGLCVASSLAFLIVAGCFAAGVATVWWAREARTSAGGDRPDVPVWVPAPAAAVLLIAYLPLVVKVLVSHAAARWEQLARRLASAGALAPTPPFPGALPLPAPWLVIAVSAPVVALACAGLVAVARRAARGRDAVRQPAGRRARHRRSRVLTWLTLAAALAVAVAAVPVASRLARRYMYVGSGTAAETVETWFEASLARDHNSSQEPFLPPTRWPASVGVVLVVSAAAVLGLLLLAALRLLLEMRQAGRDGLAAPRLAALLVAGTVSAAAAAYLAAHLVVGLHYPPPRAAVYVPPLTSAALALVLYSWRGRPRAITVLAAAVALALAARYVQQWRPDRFWGDTLDANARTAFERISALAASRGGPPVRVGGLWVFEPSLNFYRQTRGASWMAPYLRVSNPNPDAYDYFVGDGARATALERRGWVVVYRDPVAGVTVMARTSPG